MTRRAGNPTRTRRSSQETIALNVPAGLSLRISPRGFWNLCRYNRDLRLERTARGELVILPLAATETGGRNAILTMQVGIWAEADGTGIYFDSSAGFTLPNGAVRSPDTCWMPRERWNTLTPEQRKVFSPICPDFVVELCSLWDDKNTVREKLHEYISQGARLGWLLDPRDQTVEIYRPGRPVEVLKQPATLSGEDVLPGFVLDLKGILYD